MMYPLRSARLWLAPIALVLGLSGCDVFDDDDPIPTQLPPATDPQPTPTDPADPQAPSEPEPGAVRIIHASPDAPMVVLAPGNNYAGEVPASDLMLDYRQSATFSDGDGEFNLDIYPPEGAEAASLLSNYFAVAQGRHEDAFVVGSASRGTLEVFRVSAPAEPADVTQARLRVAHLVEAAAVDPRAPSLPVDVYLVAADADEWGDPVATLDYQDVSEAVSVAPGDYSIRIAPAGSDEPIFTSTAVALVAGQDLLIGAVPNTAWQSDDEHRSPLVVWLVGGPTVDPIAVYDAADGARVRVAHAMVGAGALDVVSNGDFDAPLVTDLAFGDTTDYLHAATGHYAFAAVPTGADRALIAADDHELNASSDYTLVALGDIGEAEASPPQLLLLEDSARRVSGDATVRVVHGAPIAGEVDVYLNSPNDEFGVSEPAFDALAFAASSSFRSVTPGTYRLSMTPSDAEVPVVGSQPVQLLDGGVYTFIVRGDGDGGLAFTTVGDNPDPSANGQLRVTHVAVDAPAVAMNVAGEPISNSPTGNAFNYLQSTGILALPVADYPITLDALGSDNITVSVANILSATGEDSIRVEGETRVDVFAVGRVADESFDLFALAAPAEPLDDSQVRLQVLHLVPPTTVEESATELPVEVYLTAPNAALAAPAATLDYREALDTPLTVAPGDYRIRIAPVGGSDVLYDSGTLSFAAGDDLVVAAAPNGGMLEADAVRSPVVLVVLDDTIGARVVPSMADGANLRVAHNLADVGPVDVIIDGNFEQPLVRDLQYDASADYINLPAGNYALAVVPAGATSADDVLLSLSEAELAIGGNYTLIVAGGSTEPGQQSQAILVSDSVRDVASQAGLRLVHAAPGVGTVDVYVNTPEADYTDSTAVFSNLEYSDSSANLGLPPGVYTVRATPPGEASGPILMGPINVQLIDGGNYTLIARADGGELSFDWIGEDPTPAPIPETPSATAQLRVIHAAPDTPNLFIDRSPDYIELGYLESTGILFRPFGPYNFNVDAVDAEGRTDQYDDIAAALDIELQEGQRVDAFITGTMADDSLAVISVSAPAAKPSANLARLRVAHLAVPGDPGLDLPVDVHLTPPGAPLSTAPVSLDYRQISDAISVPPGDYRIRITSVGDDALLYDSGADQPLKLVAGNDLIIAATNNPTSGQPAQSSLATVVYGDLIDPLILQSVR